MATWMLLACSGVNLVPVAVAFVVVGVAFAIVWEEKG